MGSVIGTMSRTEGYVVVIVSVITGLTGIVTAIITSRGNRKAATAAADASVKIDESVGIPNGKGTLMRQMAQSSEHQTLIQHNQLVIQDHLLKLHDTVVVHIDESCRDRANLHSKIEAFYEKLATHATDEKVELTRLANKIDKIVAEHATKT